MATYFLLIIIIIIYFFFTSKSFSWCHSSIVAIILQIEIDFNRKQPQKSTGPVIQFWDKIDKLILIPMSETSSA